MADAAFNLDGSFRRVSIVEEARIEASIVPHRRGQLYGLLADEIERLQRIIDSRPAINAGLPQTYIDWSRGIYQCDVLQAKGPANG